MMGIVIIVVDLYTLSFGARRFDCFCVAIPFWNYLECLMIMLSTCHACCDDYNEYHVSIYPITTSGPVLTQDNRLSPEEVKESVLKGLTRDKWKPEKK